MRQQIPAAYLDAALESFSGYIAVDELYDGPWCVLSIVDNHSFARLAYRVVDKKVVEADVEGLFKDFRQSLAERGLKVQGVTTDGSNLYPATIAQVFGPAVPHQVCRFHAVGAVAKAAREAVVKLYKQEVAKLPKLKGGRPRQGRPQQRAEQIKQQRQKLLELYRHRYTLVSKTPDEQKLKQLLELIEPYPQIAQVRELMQQVYGLYQQCPGSAVALVKLQEIRRAAGALADGQAKALGALLSALNGPCIEKSLVYLDHPADLPSTSNAVERANRRHRKMQKSVYRVRSKRQLERRLALDLLREQRALAREEVLMALRELRQAA